jgi:hypothetical protein
MNQLTTRPRASLPPLVTELLLLPSGEVLVHNLTPAFADLLAELGWGDGHGRIRLGGSSDGEAPDPSSPQLHSHA